MSTPTTPITPDTLAPPPSPQSFGWVSWGPRQVLLGIVAAFALSSLASVVVALPIDPDLESSASRIGAQIALWASLLAVPVAVAAGFSKSLLRSAPAALGFRRLRPRDVLLAAAVVLAYLIAAALIVAALDALLGYSPTQDELADSLALELTPATVVGLYIATCVIAPIAEETFFRGFVFGGLRAHWPFWAAALVSSLIFGSVHLTTGPAAIPLLALLGVCFAYLYERSGSLWPAVIAHALNNALALTMQITS